MTEKSEQEIIEEIINSVKSRKFRAWIYNLTFSEDDWEDDFDTMIEATEALTDALDDNGREDCEWGIDEVKTYNQIEIELAVKKALQKGKELGANECILEGKPNKGHPIPVYCPACFDELIEEQASKIEELQSLNDQLTDANREHIKRIAKLDKDLQNYQNFKDEITKLKEERKQLVDELEENLNIIKSDDCIYRDNPRVYRQIKSLEIIIKFLRGEK